MEAVNYVLENLNKKPKKVLKEKNIALVGLGPHAKRIYLNYFKKHNTNLALVIDIESNKENVCFKLYRASSGIYELLKKLTTGVRNYLRPKEREKQLQFFSLLDDF